MTATVTQGQGHRPLRRGHVGGGGTGEPLRQIFKPFGPRRTHAHTQILFILTRNGKLKCGKLSNAHQDQLNCFYAGHTSKFEKQHLQRQQRMLRKHLCRGSHTSPPLTL